MKISYTILRTFPAQKMKFFIKDFSQFPVDLVTFTGENLNGKLHFLCSGSQICQKKLCKTLHQGENFQSKIS